VTLILLALLITGIVPLSTILVFLFLYADLLIALILIADRWG